jgi:hypothetical protein
MDERRRVAGEGPLLDDGGVRGLLLATSVASLSLALAGGCAALLGANDPIEVDIDATRADGGVVIGDASRAEVGACPLCSPPQHATATCEGGACGFACVDGYHACDGGCVTDDDERACGAACVNCVPQGSTLNGYAVCKAGQCGMVCGQGWVYCGQPGVCVGLAFDCENCGTCGHRCQPGQTCSGSACVLGNSSDILCN